MLIPIDSVRKRLDALFPTSRKIFRSLNTKPCELLTLKFRLYLPMDITQSEVLLWCLTI